MKNAKFEGEGWGKANIIEAFREQIKHFCETPTYRNLDVPNSTESTEPKI